MKMCKQIFPQDKTLQEALGVKRQLTQFRYLEKIYARIGVSGPLLFFIVMFAKMIWTRDLVQKLPLNLTFPFNEYDPRVYGAVFVWWIFISFITLLPILATDLILYAIITIVVMKYDELGSNLKRLIDSNLSHKEFVALVELHIDLHKIGNSLEEIFSPSIFANFFGSSVSICLIGYQIFNGANFGNSLTYTALLCGNVVQTFLLCFYGSKLTEASEKFSTIAFYSGWETGNKKEINYTIQMMLMRSQKPSLLTAMKFSKISLQVFGSVSLLIFINTTKVFELSFADHKHIFLILHIVELS